MITKALALYSTVLATMATDRDEDGQGTLEYVGIVIIAALLVVAVVGAVNPEGIATTITNKISDITGAGAGGGGGE